MTRVLVIGGYGVFGSRIAERLARRPGMTVIVAGRHLAPARDLAARLAARPGRHEAAGACRGDAAASRASLPEAAIVDAARIGADDIRRLGAAVVVHAAGPYQGQDYRVAEAAIAAGAHYVDLADDRAFVGGIGSLDAAARRAGVLVTSGASSVPAIAAAVLDRIACDLPGLEAVTYAISPGNSFDPGPATTVAILSGLGRPFPALHDGSLRTAHGWQPLTWRRIPGAGTRLLGAWNVPDLDIFPARWPTLRSQHFLAGVEVKAFHIGLWLLAWLVRAGLLRRPERLASALLAARRRLDFLGSSTGVMLVEAEGRDRAGEQRRAAWRLIADEGHGPYVPGTPAVIVARCLAAGALTTRGAMPCVGLVSLAEIESELADLRIRSTLASPDPP